MLGMGGRKSQGWTQVIHLDCAYRRKPGEHPMILKQPADADALVNVNAAFLKLAGDTNP